MLFILKLNAMKPRILFLLWLLCAGAFPVCAQGSGIQFNVLKLAQDDVPQSVADALDVKLKGILTRNGAASANSSNVFAIEPVLEVGEPLSAEGVMQQVTLVRGELTLLVKNRVDGSLYYSLAVPLKGHSDGDREKALKSMVNGIKVSDVRYTRFVRLARQKIDDYYAANCATILVKAKSLYDTGRYAEAMSYLSAVSEVLPCYEQAAAMMAEIAARRPQPRDTIVVRRRVPAGE